MPLEVSVVDSSMKRLKSHGATVIKIHGSPLSRKGEPDLIGCHDGNAFALEAKKSDDDHPSLAQVYKLLEWKRAGARVGLIRNADDAEAIVLRGEPIGHAELLQIQNEALEASGASTRLRFE